MTIEEEFWHLNGSSPIESQEDLHGLLQVSRHITNALYEPKDLCQADDPVKCRIRNTMFERVSFSKTHISGFTFRNCIFDCCLFIGAVIEDCEFHNYKFILTNTHKISIYRTYIDPTSFRRCLIQGKHQNIGVHLYQNLLSNSRGTEQIEFERDVQFFFLRWKRFQDAYEIQNWEKRETTSRFSRKYMLKCFGYLRRLTWEKCFGSGLRFRYFVATVAITISSFTMLNYLFREEFGLMLEREPVSSCVEALYYTIISFTTLGYGDIVPTTAIGQIMASAQSLIGFCLLALLASMLFRRISP